MAITNFPNGASSWGMPLVGFGIPLAQRYFFVSSVIGSNGNEGTDPESPLSTIDFAVGKCVASKGDVIIVLPGHIETIATAAALALDVAGINLIGVGNGGLRPTLNFTGTAATMVVSAANVYMRNFLFTGGIDAVVNALQVTGVDFTMESCEYRDVTGQITMFCLATTASRMLVKDFIYRGDVGNAGTATGFAINGGTGITFDGIKSDGNFSTAFVDIRTTLSTDFSFRNAICRTRNAADVIGVDTITGSTGTIGPNVYMTLADNAANFAAAFAGATFVYHNPVSIVNLAGELGGIAPYNQAGFKAISTDA